MKHILNRNDFYGKELCKSIIASSTEQGKRIFVIVTLTEQGKKDTYFSVEEPFGYQHFIDFDNALEFYNSI